MTCPSKLAFYGANGERKKIQVRNNLQEQEFDIPLDFEPQWVDFDPDDFIDKTVQFDKPCGCAGCGGRERPSMMSRLWAVAATWHKTMGANSEARIEALAQVLGNDEFYGVRAAAATSLGNIGTEQAKTALISALQQSDSRVRTAVFKRLVIFPGTTTSTVRL